MVAGNKANSAASNARMVAWPVDQGFCREMDDTYDQPYHIALNPSGIDKHVTPGIACSRQPKIKPMGMLY